MNSGTDSSVDNKPARKAAKRPAEESSANASTSANLSQSAAVDRAAQARAARERERRARVGLIVLFTTAGVVFTVGQALLPPFTDESTKTSRNSVAPSPPAPDTVAQPAPVAAAAATAPAAGPPAPTPAPAASEPAQPVGAAPTVSAPPPSTADVTPSAARAASQPSQPIKTGGTDKDLAREAWRKNLPDVSGDSQRASLLIPIRGSIEGATYHLAQNPRSINITLPRGESMITMPFYRLADDAFKTLWIKQAAGQGSNIRLVLGAAKTPAVDIKEGFIRVTVARVAAAVPRPSRGEEVR